MAGERHLAARCEYPHLRRMRGILRRPDEGRLRKVEFGGDGLHLLPRQAFRIQDDGKRIARESIGCEHIDSLELRLHRIFPKR